MKHIIFFLFISTTVFAQTPRLKFRQIQKDTTQGSIAISNPADSQLVFSRDFYIAYGADTVLILYGDTISGVGGLSSVLSDGVTITGDGTSGNELKVDTATVISTIQGLVDSLLNYVTLTTAQTISGAKTFTSDLNVDAKIALNDGDNNIVIGDGAGASLVSGQGIRNILIGTQAGAAIDSGDYNVANGYQALYFNTTGNNNIANGANTLYNNLSGISNIANGYDALNKNTTGNRNIANGTSALFNNVSGSDNIANGTFALYFNEIGSNNVGFGYRALVNLVSGSNNQAYGYEAGRLIDGSTGLTTANGSLFIGSNTKASANGNSNEIVIGTNAIGNGTNSVTIGASTNTKNILYGNLGLGTISPSEKLDVVGDVEIDGKIKLNDGDNNVVIGDGAGASLVSGQALQNVLIGIGAGAAIDSGSYNIANGYRALYLNTLGSYNIANGYLALYSNTTGNNNIANGYQALYYNETGYENIANGYRALYNNASGINNIANGFVALYNNTSGSYNVATGYRALINLNSGSNNQAYGYNAGRYYGSGSDALTTANSSLFLGNNTRALANNSTNEIVIGTNAIGNGSNTITIGSSSTQSLHTRNYEFDIDQTVGGATDNYVLTYDSLDGQISLEPATGGTATIPVDTFVTIAGTETITGAKTFTNTFTQSGGDANFDNNTLYVDESANKVGIGKNNPSYKLDINGDVNSEIKYIKLRRDSNLTLSATDTLTWDNTVAKDDDIFSHTSGQEEIYADVSGLYHITVNLNFVNDNNVDRSTVRARLVKNTTLQTHSAGYTYLRGQNGNINGTITISDMIELSTNDYIYVIIDRIASNGSGETLIASESQIIIRRLGY